MMTFNKSYAIVVRLKQGIEIGRKKKNWSQTRRVKTGQILLVVHEFPTDTTVASYSGVFNKAVLLFSSGGNAVVSIFDAVLFGI